MGRPKLVVPPGPVLETGGRDPAVLRRFWAKVDKAGPPHPYREDLGNCWMWVRAMDPNGYGRFGVYPGHSIVLAHRFSYAAEHGSIPAAPNNIVRHTCDRPGCVRPGHLAAGTLAENTGDMVARGRGRGSSRPGEANPQARLTAEQVAAMRARRAQGAKLGALVAEFGLSKTQTARIIRGLSWSPAGTTHTS